MTETKVDLIKRTYFDNMDLSNREIAKLTNTSRRHVRRTLNSLRTISNEKSSIPKILILDIETMMMTVFVWYLGKQRIPYNNVIDEWNCISWAGKWLFDPVILSDVQTPQEAINRDDKRIMLSLWDVMNQADIIIGHNLVRFDKRKVNARFLYHNLTPVSSYQTIDTLTELKKHFSLSSYKLDDVCKFLGLQTKVHTEYDLWKKCLKGDLTALKQMSDYNKNDTLITEELYLKIRGYIKSHPNLGLYMETEGSVCPNCGSDYLEQKGNYYTPAGRFNSFRCQNCGAVSRSKYSDLSKEEKERLLISIAR